MTNSVDDLVRRIQRLENALRRTNTPQLANSSIEDGALEGYVGDDLTMIIGQQHDGTNGAFPVTGPPPPQPSTPTVESIIGGIKVKVPGTFADPTVMIPMDFSRWEVHVSQDPEFFPGLGATLYQTIESPQGGEVNLALPYVPHYVRIVARALTGKGSTPSLMAGPVQPRFVEQLDLDPDIELGGGGGGPDGEVPASSPDVIASPLGIGGVLAAWAPVSNADPVSYDVFVSSAPITSPDPQLLLSTTPATQVAITAMPDGTPLPEAPVYVRVLARDEDGPAAALGAEGSATPRKATNADIASDFVYAGMVNASQIQAGALQAILAVLGGLTVGDLAGKHIKINPEVGFELVNSAGAPIVHFPISGQGVNKFVGDLVAEGFTAMGKAQFRGDDNEISTNSTFTLASGVTAPVNVPSIDTAYRERYTASLGGNRPFSYVAATGELATLTGNEWTSAAIRLVNLSTGAVTNRSLTFMAQTGIGGPADTTFTKFHGAPVRIGGFWYLMYQVSVFEGGLNSRSERRVGKFDASTGVQTALFNYDPYSYTKGVSGFMTPVVPNDPVLGTDGANLLIGQTNPADGKLRIQTFSTAWGNPISTWMSSVPITGPGDSVAGSSPLQGTFDLGTSTVFVKPPGSSSVWAFDTNGTRTPQYDWDSGASTTGSSVYDVAWTGTRFVVNSGGQLYKMSTSLSAEKVQAGFTWYDSDPGGTGTHETTIGPVATATRRPRYGVSIVATVPPNDAGDSDSPDSHRLYAYQGNAYTGPSQLKLQPAATVQAFVDGAQTWTTTQSYIDGAVGGSSAPPAANSFPNGAAAELTSDIGGFVVRGDGTGAWPYIVNPINTRITTLEDAKAATDTRLSNVEGRATLLEGRATNLESRAGSLETRATSSEGRLTVIESTIAYANRYQSNAQSVLNATFTNMNLDTVDSSHPDIQWFSGTRDFTVWRSGLYIVDGSVVFSGTINGAMHLRFTQNGSGIKQVSRSVTNGATDCALVGTGVFYLTVGDSIAIQGRQASGGTLNTFPGASRTVMMSITRIG